MVCFSFGKTIKAMGSVVFPFYLSFLSFLFIFPFYLSFLSFLFIFPFYLSFLPFVFTFPFYLSQQRWLLRQLLCYRGCKSCFSLKGKNNSLCFADNWLLRQQQIRPFVSFFVEKTDAGKGKKEKQLAASSVVVFS